VAPAIGSFVGSFMQQNPGAAPDAAVNALTQLLGPLATTGNSAVTIQEGLQLLRETSSSATGLAALRKMAADNKWGSSKLTGAFAGAASLIGFATLGDTLQNSGTAAALAQFFSSSSNGAYALNTAVTWANQLIHGVSAAEAAGSMTLTRVSMGLGAVASLIDAARLMRMTDANIGDKVAFAGDLVAIAGAVIAMSNPVGQTIAAAGALINLAGSIISTTINNANDYNRRLELLQQAGIENPEERLALADSFQGNPGLFQHMVDAPPGGLGMSIDNLLQVRRAGSANFIPMLMDPTASRLATLAGVSGDRAARFYEMLIRTTSTSGLMQLDRVMNGLQNGPNPPRTPQEWSTALQNWSRNNPPDPLLTPTISTVSWLLTAP
jgi:hypothetical protein